MTEVVRFVIAILGVTGIAWGLLTLRMLAPRANRSQMSGDQVRQARGVFAIGLLQIVGGVAWLIAAIARAEWAVWLALATVLAAPVIRLIVRRHTGQLT